MSGVGPAEKRPTRDWLALRPWQRHSLVLTVAGLVYVIVGIAYALIPLTPARAQTLQLALWLMPIQAWAAVWVAAGGCAIVSGRWPEFSDTWGYIALEALSTLWAVFYLLAVFAGHGAGVSGFCVWALVAFVWWAVSGLRNPVPRPALWIDESQLPDSLRDGDGTGA